MKMELIKQGAKRALGRSGLLLKKHSPEILIASGVVAIGAGFVLGCKATLKAHEVREEYEEKRDEIETARQMVEDGRVKEETYPVELYKRDKGVALVQMGFGYTKLYGPSVTLMVGGIGCFLAAYGIMHKRNVALMAAYEAVSKSFADYRQRVIAKEGEEADKRYMYGFEQVMDGKKPAKDEEGNTITTLGGGTLHPSIYAKFFDESSPEWVKSAEANLLTLHARQAWAQQKLVDQGHLFLNEVYDMLGIPRTSAGAMVGWIYNGAETTVIDFGIYEVYKKNPKWAEMSQAFVNGLERSILLDFNVDGVIYDLI